jgi:hypothetical protein
MLLHFDALSLATWNELKMKNIGVGREWKQGAALLVTSIIAFAARAERINQEGRILGPLPVVSAPILFNTPQADAVVSAMQIFPLTSAWNEDISHRPVLSNSAAMITQIKTDLSLSRQTLRPFYEMNYVLVSNSQARVTIPFLDYPDESDLTAAPSPTVATRSSNMPTKPAARHRQFDAAAMADGCKQHRRRSSWHYRCARCRLDWETWQMKLTQSGWQSSNGAS